MGINTEYVARMNEQLKQWDADLDAFAARSELAGAEARAASQDRIKDLRANRDAARKSLQRMRAAGEAAGAQMKAGMEEAWKTMRTALQKASSTLGA